MILALRQARLPAGAGRLMIVISTLLGTALVGFDCLAEKEGEDATRDRSRTAARPITLGDIEPEEPLRRVRWIQPLADHLADRLRDQGIDGGRVVVARSVEEMTRFLREGTVDLYLDSPLATLEVVKAAEARVLLRRWVRDEPEYWSLFLTHRESGLASPGDLGGRTIAFQERHSTTGFLLPAYTLIERGFEIRAVPESMSTTPPGQIGCFFTGDEENSIQLLLAEKVAAAVISNQDFDDLPAELKSSLVILDRTPGVPRQLVSARPGLDPALVARVRQILLTLADEDRARLAAEARNGSWTWRFDELPAESLARLERYSATLSNLVVD